MGAVEDGGRRTFLSRGPTTTPWYGDSPAWQIHLERDVWIEHTSMVRREQGIGMSWRDHTGWLAYRHEGLWVPGRTHPIPVTVAFFEAPPYDCYGLKPEDYPRVWADCGALSKHRMPDDALCLYYPWSPLDGRWTATDGLLALLDLTRDHLYFEDYWRRSGGPHHGEWLGDEAPHGSPVGRAS